MKKEELLLLIIECIVIILLNSMVYAWPVDSGEEVHQHITNESQEIWKLLPFEIKDHIGVTIQTGKYPENYNPGDTIIHGSSEEDAPIRWMEHFWDPDNPKNGEYSDGLNNLGNEFLMGMIL